MIHKDCRYYQGDRPCRFHKEEGVKCGDCPRYSPFRGKILIIKLDAVGDVLRTTSLLARLKRRFPDSHLTWITGKASLPIFVNNPFVDRVLPLQPAGLICVLAEQFLLSVNLDTAPVSASLHSLVRAGEKKGFTLDQEGRVCACSPAAEEWLLMSIFDDVKKNNNRTCQSIMSGILELPSPDDEIVLNLSPEELLLARRFAQKHGLEGTGPLIGFNTGAGRRWKHKKWTEEGTLALARLCAERLGATLLLYGGPEEEERNRRLLEAGEGIFIDTGCRNDLRTFFALLSLPDLVVTSDTLALHAALGLQKKVVALFGPTSAAEIDLYGRGEKVVSSVPCQCCYRIDCEVVPDCMESITPEMVFAAIQKLI